MDVSQYSIFSRIDLKSAFWQLPLAPECREYTGMTIPGRGIFRWKVVPFGLGPSCTLFQKSMTNLLYPLLATGNVFLDILEQPFHTLCDADLQINPKKLELLLAEIKILGVIMSGEGTRPNPDRIQGVLALAPPKDRKALGRLLGMAGYLRSFIPGYASFVAPFQDLQKKGAPWEWKTTHQQAFEKLRGAIASATMVHHPDPSKPFFIMTDASDKAISFVLFQGSLDEPTPIHWGSRLLTEVETRWTTSEKEIYSLVVGLETFECYYGGSLVIAYTDHKSLLWLSTAHQPKLRRWAQKLSRWDVEIRHINGTDNLVADLLSRDIHDEPVSLQEVDIPICSLLPNVMKAPSWQELALHAQHDQTADPNLQLRWVEGHPFDPISNRLYVPRALRDLILFQYHGSSASGHPGINKVVKKLGQTFWWPCYCQDIERWVRSCVLCARLRPANAFRQQGTLLGEPQAFKKISLDYVGPLQWCGNHIHILVCVDHATRFMATSWTTAQSSNHILEFSSFIMRSRHGLGL
eukprot:Blabericola_migrator_1__4628@NODE_2452_length_2737_cov_74_009738_g1447_i1_p1_GENE_NODE_2452_length_2737_cov_74_009738_g1447_i1NODE_2452_length_2737_cov_74_009738_g1447_i1_p1_ORF_typecomplete_len522_score50_87RT_RNaseH_2/PF17919_1/4_5e24RT_RNaseH/PF17917_1/8_8e22Integrase_H2C2/PF17921_1/4_7e15RVT_1/PF00078_27/4e05zfH2C2/PF09337_10/0_0067_NODE_2452_length_2737_cov_74_009738_g1447_i13781943